MADDTIQYNHPQLKSVGQRFNDQSVQVKAEYDKIMKQLEVLKGGAWVGPNFDEFYKIMTQTLMPGVKRLYEALDKAEDTSNQVSKIMQDADEENKGLFPA